MTEEFVYLGNTSSMSLLWPAIVILLFWFVNFTLLHELMCSMLFVLLCLKYAQVLL